MSALAAAAEEAEAAVREEAELGTEMGAGAIERGPEPVKKSKNAKGKRKSATTREEAGGGLRVGGDLPGEL